MIMMMMMTMNFIFHFSYKISNYQLLFSTNSYAIEKKLLKIFENL